MNGGCDVDKMADAWVDEGVGGVGGGMGGGRTGSTNGVDAGAANEGEGVGVEVAPPFSFLFSLYRVVYSVLFRWILLLLLHAEKDSSLKNQKKNSVKPGKTQPTRSGLCWAIGNPSMARVGFDANPVKPGKTQRTHVLLSLSLFVVEKAIHQRKRRRSRTKWNRPSIDHYREDSKSNAIKSSIKCKEIKKANGSIKNAIDSL